MLSRHIETDDLGGRELFHNPTIANTTSSTATKIPTKPNLTRERRSRRAISRLRLRTGAAADAEGLAAAGGNGGGNGEDLAGGGGNVVARRSAWGGPSPAAGIASNCESGPNAANISATDW